MEGVFLSLTPFLNGESLILKMFLLLCMITRFIYNYPSCDYQYVLFSDYPYVPCNSLQCQYLLALFIGLSIVIMWSQAIRLTRKSKLVLDGQRKNKGLHIFWIDFYSSFFLNLHLYTAGKLNFVPRKTYIRL